MKTYAVILLLALSMVSCRKDPPPVEPPAKGHPGVSALSGGSVMQSEKFRLILTTGDSPGGNTKQTNNNNTLNSGLIGATH